MFARSCIFLYGIASYVVFLAAFLYAIGFVGNLLVPKSIDTGSAGSTVEAFIVDAILLGIFAIQHSVMARPGFKRWWTTIVPRTCERSTYVLISSLLLFLLFWQWQPLPAQIWKVTGDAGRATLWGIFWLGWVVVLVSTFAINHFDLFGLQQVFAALRGRETAPPIFKTPFLYKLVRHPIMIPARVLGDAGHDRRAPAVLRPDDGLHSDRASIRGAGPDRAVRLGVQGIPQARADDRALPAQALSETPGPGP